MKARRCGTGWLLAGALLAQGANAEGARDAQLEATLTYGHGTDPGARMHSLVELRPEYSVALSENSSVVLSARLRVDADDDIEPGTPDYDNYWGASRPARIGDVGSLELRDAYVSLPLAKGVLRLGKQQVVWGRLDGLKVLDVVNPQDFRYFIVEDFNDSRITLWSAYADLSLGKWRTELVVVPDSSGHAIPDPGAWFELRAPRFRFGASPGTPGVPVETQAPDGGIDDTGLGVRVSRQLGVALLSVVAHSGRDPEPLGRIDDRPGGPVLIRELERRETFGASADIGLGSVVLRLEHAQHPGRQFNTNRAGLIDRVRRDQYRSAIGLDLNGPLESLINVQLLEDRVANAPADLVRPRRDRIATVALRKTIGFDAWEFQARWYRSLDERDSMATLLIKRTLSERTSLTFEVAAFRGTEVGLFGQFGDRNMATLSLQHAFR